LPYTVGCTITQKRNNEKRGKPNIDNIVEEIITYRRRWRGKMGEERQPKIAGN
jgi:hypothetical protein